MARRSRFRTGCLVACLWFGLGFGPGLGARATAQPLCVVDASAADYASLLRAEIQRHGRALAPRDCMPADLVFERHVVEGRRYLTGRFAGEVPHRVRVGDDPAEAVTELVRVVLHSDPMRLVDPAEQAGLAGALQRLREVGQGRWMLELHERLGVLRGRFFAVPGVALRARRELAGAHVGARLSLSGRTSALPDELAWVASVALAAELAHFFRDDAPHSGYVAGTIGLAGTIFRGPRADRPERYDLARGVGLELGIRCGVELFRTLRQVTDLFVHLSAPLHRVHDPAHQVVRRWFPTLTLGVAVGL